ncbi:unnamed protein product [Rotaria sp. Silwood1]|nr:unnamed protein product [Rotaria sp. Silwood1]
MFLLWLFILFPSSIALKSLMVTIGAGGHVIPLFELAKAMKHHHVTFITEPYAKYFIDFDSYQHSSSFRILYTNDSADAPVDQIKIENDLEEYFANHSLVESLSQLIPSLARSIDALLRKTVHILMIEQFDVIIVDSFIKGIHTLSDETNTPCVIQTAGVKLDEFHINLPHMNSFLSSKQITLLKYRIYNAAFHLRLIASIAMKLLPLLSTFFRSPPQVPGRFYETLTLKNQIFTTTKCLQLYSFPETLFLSSDSDPYKKYLGAFIDETSNHYVNNDLVRWIQSKPKDSIIYVSVGSIARIQIDRMKSLIEGLMEFLLKTPTASILFAFRQYNYDNFQKVKKEIGINEYQNILSDEQRCRVENHFVPQKWLLQQNSVSLFISHCGMGSIGESLYFRKPILCLPLCKDQFVNAMAIDYSGVGQSLFVPPSAWQSLIQPDRFHYYTFSANDVTKKLLIMWKNTTYEKAVQMMSLEMKHAGGVKRAVEEIEFFVNVNGNLDRYVPFQNSLPFYQ